MKKYFSLWLLTILSCNPIAEIEALIKSDVEFQYFECYHGDCFFQSKIDRHGLVYIAPGVSKKNTFIEKLNNPSYFPQDSVLFINLDSTYKVVFVNPTIDDYQDYNKKLDAHFWNPSNWEQKNWNDNACFIIREVSFEKYKEPIM